MYQNALEIDSKHHFRSPNAYKIKKPHIFRTKSICFSKLGDFWNVWPQPMPKRRPTKLPAVAPKKLKLKAGDLNLMENSFTKDANNPYAPGTRDKTSTGYLKVDKNEYYITELILSISLMSGSILLSKKGQTSWRCTQCLPYIKQTRSSINLWFRGQYQFIWHVVRIQIGTGKRKKEYKQCF